MASREHSCTRRALLAGAVGAPAALTLPPLRDGCPSPEMGEGLQGELEAALAALRSAEAEMGAFKRAEPRGVSFAQQWALDAAFSDLGGAHDGAVERLLLVPAPDLAALAVKIALAVEQMAWELPEGARAMALDAARIATAG